MASNQLYRHNHNLLYCCVLLGRAGLSAAQKWEQRKKERIPHLPVNKKTQKMDIKVFAKTNTFL